MERNMEVAEQLRVLIHTMVRSLVDTPEMVEVTPVQQAGCVLLNVSVPLYELGKVIGKQGRTARAMRTVLCAASRTLRMPCELNIEGDIRNLGDEALAEGQVR